jgi:hypothetical protein
VAGRYTAAQFIKAIPGTGGIISALAEKVGCTWHTARNYVENYTTVTEVWEAERNKITDKAKHNIVKSIQKGDLQMSKWWLQVLDDDFVPRQRVDQQTDGKMEIVVTYAESRRDDTEAS